MEGSQSGPSLARNVVFPQRQTAALKSKPHVPKAEDASGLIALSVEFVAKPEKASSARAAIPAAIAGAFQDVAGFAGCLVMVSAEEARLVTVVTLWAGIGHEKCRRENLRWVQALLAPFVDHCLRVQTMVAHGPMLPCCCAGTNAGSAGSLREDFASPGEKNASVA